MFTPEDIKAFLDLGVEQTPAIENYNDLRIHYTGEYPKHLIDSQRPNEPKEVKEYRQESFESETYGYMKKVIAFSKKGYQAQDFAINFPDFPKHTNEATLEEYCMNELPYLGNIVLWAEEYMHSKMLLDANCYIVVLPDNINSEVTDYYRPFGKIVHVDQVYYASSEVFLYLSNEKSDVLLGDSTVREGFVFYEINKDEIIRHYQYGEINARMFASEVVLQNPFDELPIFKTSAQLEDLTEKGRYNISVIQGLVPNFNDAARSDSDLQASYTLHCFPEKYEYVSQECTSCNGTGKSKRKDSNGHAMDCQACNGTGMNTNSTFGRIYVNLNNRKPGQEGALPNPPAGYITKDIETIDKLKEKVEGDIYKGLSALNLEHLMEVQINQSGTAKEFDRQEVNNFLSEVFRRIVSNLDNLVYWIAKWRYQSFAKNPVLNDEQLEASLPSISVPRKYDVLTSAMVYEKISNLQTSGASDAMLAPYRLQALKLDFGEDSEIYLKEKLYFDFLPFIESDIANVSLMKGQAMISELDAILQSNLKQILTYLTRTVKGFLYLEYEAQKELIEGRAKELQEVIESEQEVPIELVD